MALSEADRAALRSAWQAMDPSMGAASVAATAASGDVAKGGGDTEMSAEQLAGTVNEWVQSLTALPPEQQLEELEAALGQEEDEAIAEQLQRAKSALLNRNKALAARIALFRYAYEHPLLSLAGVLGLLGMVVMVAKGIFFKLF